MAFQVKIHLSSYPHFKLSHYPRDKGLAGMAENVRQGYRAGGRAPYGYQLARIETGTVRDGMPVTKTRLEPGEDAPRIAAYLKDRAAGVPRTVAARKVGLDKPASTLIGMEWNALTYAGCTVWNVHAEMRDGGYKGGHKRRPRDQWVIHEDTHPALISREEAETLLACLEQRASKRAPRYRHFYLLSGLLVTPGGRLWQGDQNRYYALPNGTKKIRVRKDRVEQAVLAQIAEDARSQSMVTDVLDTARAMIRDTEPDETRMVEKRLDRITGKLSRMVSMAADMENPGAVLREIDTLEAERDRIERSLEEARARQEGIRTLQELSEADVEAVLDDLARDVSASQDEALKTMLGGLLERIQLDGQNLELHYGLCGAWLASPRGFESGPKPVIRRVVGW